MNRWSLTVLALLFSCSPGEEHAHPYVRTSEDPKTKAFRDRITLAIQGTNHLLLKDRTYISDGGSIVYSLTTESGTEFELQALHHNERMGGSKKFQVFLIYGWKENTEFELLHGSPLEQRLVPLLEQCRLGTETRNGWEPVTAETHRWLVDRLRNRSLPFD